MFTCLFFRRTYLNSYATEGIYFSHTKYVRFISSSFQPCIIRSKVSDIDIPKITLDEFVWRNLDKWHDKTALVCAETGRSYLYSEIYKKSRSLANFLHNFKGISQGDTVAIVLPNVPEYPIIMLGAIAAGLKVTTANPIYTADELVKQFQDSDTKLVFTLSKLWLNVDNAIKRLSPRKDISIVVVEHENNQSIPSKAIKFREITNGSHKLLFHRSINFDDVIILPYSSGTTGLPKGVELTMGNMISCLYQVTAPEFKLQIDTEGSDQDVAPAILPMFHIYGIVALCLNLLSSGSKLITVPKFGQNVLLSILENHTPTIFCLVPPILLMLVNNPNIQFHHIEQIRTILSGAAPLGATDIERINEKSKGKTTILQGYGLTETSSIVLLQSKRLKNGVKLGGSGYIAPNTECKIISTDDRKMKIGLGPNQPGELIVRGPQVMRGYRNNLKATSEAIDSDGWFRTGDIAHYDEDGHFFITDRLKELIKVRGFQVAPAELEELLRGHPEIEDAAVVGVPHKIFGEVPKAFIVPRKSSSIKSSTIQEYIAEKVAKYKQLVGGVVITDSIPKSLAGKILRRQLNEMK